MQAERAGAEDFQAILGDAARGAVVIVWLLMSPILVGAETQGFRGDGNGRFLKATPPLKWSEDNGVVWKTKLPGRSHSSPLLVGSRLIVSSDPAELLCLDADSGKIIWQRSHDYKDVFPEEQLQRVLAEQEQLKKQKKQIGELNTKLRELRRADAPAAQTDPLKKKIRQLKQEQRDRTRFPSVKRGGSGNSAATPVTDGERLYVAYAHGVVAGYQLDGKRLWTRHLAPSTANFGHSASPVLADGKLLIHFRDLVALDAKTGEEAWRTQSNVRWGTPLVTRLGGTSVVATAGGDVIRVQDGKVLARKLYSLGHNSPIIDNDILYALDAGKLKAYQLPATADGQPQLLWEGSIGKQRTFASPALYEDLLYHLSETGILQVIDAKTGDSVYKKRLDFGRRGRVFSSITVAGKSIYLASENGTCLVIEPGREYKELARNQLEAFHGSPVFSGKRLFTRGGNNLYCIQED